MTNPTSKRILLVDDDPAGAELTAAALSEFQLGAQIDILSDGKEALDYLFNRGEFADQMRQPPAVVLLDLKMPRVDGHEVLRQIRADQTLRNLPVIVLTSSDREADITLSRQLGSNAYMVKPVSIDEFMSDIKALKPFWQYLERTPPG